mgnify:CR=1 FL=1
MAEHGFVEDVRPDADTAAAGCLRLCALPRLGTAERVPGGPAFGLQHLEKGLGLARQRLHLDALAPRQPGLGLQRPLVAADRAERDPVLDARARHAGQPPREEAVQSLAAALRCLDVYRPRRAELGLPDEWVLRRYAWVGADDEQVPLADAEALYDAAGARAYTADVESDSVSVIDLSARRVVATLKTGSRPYTVALAAGRIFVANQHADSVSVFDATSLAPVGEALRSRGMGRGCRAGRGSPSGQAALVRGAAARRRPSGVSKSWRDSWAWRCRGCR